MKVLFRNLPNGRSALSISNGYESSSNELAAPLIVSARVDDVTHDRLWVAAALCFGPAMVGRWLSGPAISETAYTAISEYLNPDGLFYVSNVVSESPDYKTGVSARLVQSSGLFRDDSRFGAQLDDEFMVLEMVPLGNWSGSLFSLHHYIVATNGFLHDVAASGRATAGGSLATAILMSNDLSIDEISIDRSVCSPSVFGRWHQLLAAVGLNLVQIG